MRRPGPRFTRPYRQHRPIVRNRVRLCEHDEIAYEITTRTVRPFKWKVHTLRCKSCGTKALLVNKEKL